MKLPPSKKILREDLKDMPKGFEPAIDILNSFMENVYQALNRNITFTENIRAFVKELTYKTSATYPVEADMQFLNELKVKATGLWPIHVVDRSTYLPVAGPVYVPWIEDNGLIVVKAITGLEASKTYSVRLLII